MPKVSECIKKGPYICLSHENAWPIFYFPWIWHRFNSASEVLATLKERAHEGNMMLGKYYFIGTNILFKDSKNVYCVVGSSSTAETQRVHISVDSFALSNKQLIMGIVADDKFR